MGIGLEALRAPSTPRPQTALHMIVCEWGLSSPVDEGYSLSVGP